MTTGKLESDKYTNVYRKALEAALAEYKELRNQSAQNTMRLAQLRFAQTVLKDLLERKP